MMMLEVTTVHCLKCHRYLGEVQGKQHKTYCKNCRKWRLYKDLFQQTKTTKELK